ncbi:MAG: hypothetical protein HY096_01590 [Nitrospinae bacterium]|nr:hypothetical protein [Nitrospinota bacterium]
MFNRRDFIKSGIGLTAYAILPYNFKAFEMMLLQKGYDNNNARENMLNHVHDVIKMNPVLHNKGGELVELADVCVRHGYPQKATNILSEAIEVAHDVTAVKDNVRYFHKITSAYEIHLKSAKVYYSMGDCDKAYKTISNKIMQVSVIAKKNHHAVLLIIDTAKVLYKNGEKDFALSLLNAVFEASLNRPSSACSNYTTIKIVETYCELGLHNIAEEIKDKIVLDRNKQAALIYIAGGYADTGSKERAHEILENVSKNIYREELSIVYAKLGEWKKAFEMIKDNDVLVLINCPYIKIARHAIYAGRKDAAVKALNKTIEAVEENYDCPDLWLPLMIKVMNTFLQMGDINKAKQLCNQVINYALINHDELWTIIYVESLSKLAGICIKLGNMQEAKRIINIALADVISQDEIYKGASLLNITKASLDNNIPIY